MCYNVNKYNNCAEMRGMKMQVKQYTKTLCMRELTIKLTDSTEPWVLEPEFTNPAICFVASGGALVRYLSRETAFAENQLFYVPGTSKCRISFRNAGKGIHAYIIHIKNNFPEKTVNNYALQAVGEMSDGETLGRIKQMYERLSGQDRIDAIRAVGEYYGFYADLLPHLTKAEPQRINPALAAAVEYIERHYCEDYSHADLCAACSISRSRLSHLFDEQLGKTPLELRNQYRIERASKLLRTTDAGIFEIAADCGFKDAAYFGRIFARLTGSTPSEYRRNKGMEG